MPMLPVTNELMILQQADNQHGAMTMTHSAYPPVHPRLSEITARITARSRVSRARYLEKSAPHAVKPFIVPSLPAVTWRMALPPASRMRNNSYAIWRIMILQSSLLTMTCCRHISRMNFIRHKLKLHCTAWVPSAVAGGSRHV